MSFDESPPVEIVSSRETSHDYEDQCEEDLLPELQEDDLFSTYESLKAHASPSPPTASLWTDLSNQEKKVRGSAKTQPKIQTKTEIATKSETCNGRSSSPASQANFRPITFRELDVSRGKFMCYIVKKGFEKA